MKELTSQQIDNIDGGVGIPGAIVGAVSGGITYLASAATSGSGNVGGFAVAVAGGAVGGFVSGGAVSVARAYATTKVAFAGGAAAGLTQE
ncbi:hypothetical protein [Opacimonas viscosa]|uniref:Bacteriocin n=1 Tax=Opacimonas viscosa TaxID=2961944 RepID=A0AA42BM88_9ALTE|nr:hypothetical protein [Opacimonas viscosa]MCP3429565.1 hypothetical protein [Opacimonas viscosa]